MRSLPGSFITLSVIAFACVPAPGSAAVITEVYSARAPFEARLGVVRTVGFDDIDTSAVDPMAFAANRYGASLGIVITGASGQYASRGFGFPADYPPSSAPNEYAPGPIETTIGGGNETQLTFVTGSQPAGVAGIGVVFIDPDVPFASSLTLFDQNGMQLASESVPAADGALVFRGLVTVDDVTGTPTAIIARARVVNGTGWPAGTLNDGVPLDDLVFGVPGQAGSSTTTTSTTVASSTTTTTLCASTPRVRCRKPTRTGKSMLRVRNETPDVKDRLVWKWAKGAMTRRVDFGDPLTTTSFTLCGYDDSGLMLVLTIPPGGTCAGRACWRRTAVGFAYDDEELSPDGVLALRLREGEEGGARIVLKAKGPNLRLPALPLRTPVTVQLLRSDDQPCWDARFPAARKNTSTLFKARSE